MKELTKTHFGPEEDPFTVEFTMKQEEMRRTQLNADLSTQIAKNSAQKAKWAAIGRREDLQQLARAGEVMLEEHQEWREKDKGKKDLFARTWIEQDKIKKQEKTINDELLRLPEQRQPKPKDMEGGEQSPKFTTLIV